MSQKTNIRLWISAGYFGRTLLYGDYVAGADEASAPTRSRFARQASEAPRRLKPALNSNKLRGPEGPLFHEIGNFLAFFFGEA